MQNVGRAQRMTRIALRCIAMLVLLAFAGTAMAEPPKWLAMVYNKDKQAVLMRFAPVPGATEYKILRSETKGADYKEIASSKQAQFFDETADPGMMYYYVFTAVTPDGVSEQSVEKEILIPGEKRAKPLPPPAIQKYTPTVRSEMGKTVASVLLVWSQERAAEATGFNVYRSLDEKKEAEMIGSTGVGEFSFSDKAVEVGKTYFYSVSALDNNLEETPRAEVKSVKIEAAVAVVKAKVTKLKQPIPRGTELLWQTWNETEETATKPSRGKLNELYDLVYDAGRGQLFVTVATNRNIAVVDASSGKIQKYLGPKFGEAELGQPLSIAQDASGTLYVADQKKSTVFALTPEGGFVRSYVAEQKDEAQPIRLIGVAVIGERVYTSDNANAKIIVFDLATGKELSRWGKQGSESVEQLRGIGSIKPTPDGNVAIADSPAGMIKIFSPEGKYLDGFGERKPIVEGFQFISGFVILANGHYLVTDIGPHLVKEFNIKSEERQYQADLSNADGTGRAEMYAPLNIVSDGKDKIWITEGMTNRLSSHKLGKIYEPVKK